MYGSFFFELLVILELVYIYVRLYTSDLLATTHNTNQRTKQGARVIRAFSLFDGITSSEIV